MGARSFPGYPYDGHTMHEQIEQSAIIMQGLGIKPSVVYTDLGYRGVDKDNPDIEIRHRGKDKRLTDEGAGYSNDGKRSSRSSGTSKLITAWTAATSKAQKVMHCTLCCAVLSGLQHPLAAGNDCQERPGPFVVPAAREGFEGLFEKLAEIFGLNRLQNSNQRWALA